MSDFRTYNKIKRVPGRPMERVSDPAGWTVDDLKDIESWTYRFTDADRAELIVAANAARAQGIEPEAVTRGNFRLDGLARTLADVRSELRDGRGMIMLRNFPVDELDRLGQVLAYLGLGCYLGTPMSQNMQGHILGHVKDLGGDYRDPQTRGYYTRDELQFHSDGCDYVGLLCLKTAMRGGESLVASSVTIYNTMLERRPDLAQALIQDYYRSRKGDVNPGDDPWYKQPVFAFHEGLFFGIGAGDGIDKALKLSGVPPLSPVQREAIDVCRQVTREVAAQIPFLPGDIQFLNNWIMLHSRLSYEDWPDPALKRHLLRLWLVDRDSRNVSKDQREGRAGRGVLPIGVKLNAPLDVE
jgi:hypothetical protein